MKRYSFYVLMAFVLFTSSLQAFDFDCFLADCCSDLSVNARVAYYRPSSKKVREIYSNNWAEYQLELSTKFYDNWQLWTGVSGFSEKGRSLGFDHRTRLRLFPLSIGLKYVTCVAPNVEAYLGGGLCYSFLRIRDHSHYVHEHTNKGAFGGVIQSGIYTSFMGCFFTNIFLDYFYQRFNFPHSQDSPYVERNDLNMSGLKVGVGIGMYF